MKSSKTAPVWAVNLVTQVCSDYKRALPMKFQWYNRNRKHSCGHTMYDGSKVHVAAGTDEWEHRPVLLHELTHHLISKTRKGRKAGHSLGFWKLYFELNAKYANIEDAYKRDIELATEWRPGTRRKAIMAYDLLPKEKAAGTA